MLTALRIENFAIVKLLELDFTRGMSAFTGETGAGKSIMIDALLLALGGRADASVVRYGEEKCDIHATFQIDNASEPANWLTKHDLNHEDGEVYLRRVIYSEGRSRSYINGQPFPLQKIKELSEMLVHIHGQHQHQTLMLHQTHREQLDRFANHDKLVDDVYYLYRQCQKIKNEIDTLKTHENSKDRIELLQFQIDELSNLALQENEIKQLNEEHQLLHRAQDYIHYTQQISQLLNADNEPCIHQQLNLVLHLLQDLPHEQTNIKNALELINSALIQCEEALDEIQHFGERIQLDPERLQEIENRLSVIHHMARKYHVGPEQIIHHLTGLQEELQAYQDAKEKIILLEQQYQNQLQAYEKDALKLHNSRVIHAEKLANEISKIIKQLGMPKGKVSIEITSLDKMQPYGLDKVEYKVCTNPGMAPDSLNKIASGGELSRISLAIQMITAQRGATPTLIFDEVDVGIGGATAALVGQLLRQLGERLQVFCVTHQPQVAAAAHYHFVVEKFSDNQQTYSHIVALSEKDKVDEIARMLGGLTITEQTRNHAEELLLSSKKSNKVVENTRLP
ncbi:DNA repair ATPase [Legionella busanensis]|uniref:DNA repair protein RecN n=1 Tax=Legionella busanensis TaxID=190655 RepID=A0A378JNI1_9GAMM|nr:DNA repair protein RecN [Legionella busanensis]STX52814.1 DNA repair ATPase [Legionella busanensis]